MLDERWISLDVNMNTFASLHLLPASLDFSFCINNVQDSAYNLSEIQKSTLFWEITDLLLIRVILLVFLIQNTVNCSALY